jgi:hypothetical protein
MACRYSKIKKVNNLNLYFTRSDISCLITLNNQENKIQEIVFFAAKVLANHQGVQ